MLSEREAAYASSNAGDPFKATQLWKEVITNFRAGMPGRRQRVKMRFYDNCFTGSEAVHWLHDYLHTTKLFGAAVTAQQVEKLLQKFLTSDVIEEVRKGKTKTNDVIEEVRKGKTKNFTEADGNLYKFVTRPGPFNFVGDENSTPCKDKWRSFRPATPGTSLGKRKRRRGENMAVGEGTCFSNEHASTSHDEESFLESMVTSPVMDGRGSERMRESQTEGSSGGSKKEGSSGDHMEVALGSPPKRYRREAASVCGVGCPPPPPPTEASSGGVAQGEMDPTVVANIWKELTLNRLLLLVELPSLDGVLTQDTVDGSNIAFNVSSVARIVGGACSSAAHSCLAAVQGGSSQVPRPLAPACHVMKRRSSSRDRLRSSYSPFHSCRHRPSDAFPRWVILSMQCLENWPESCSEEFVGGMPIYSGFEEDVFLSLVQFFHSQPHPLISTALYDLYMAVLKLVSCNHAHCVEALQLCHLLLPRQNGLRLHQVMQFVNKAGSNSKLRLSKDQSNSSVLLEKLGGAVLRRCSKTGQNEAPASRDDLWTMVAFMAKHYQSMLNVPEDLKSEVYQRIAQLRQGQGNSPVEVKRTFCQRVSTAQYEEQKKCHAHQDMGALLEGILAHNNMSDKEKCIKLKMFRKQYPDVYSAKMMEMSHPLLDLASKSVGRGKLRSSNHKN